MIGFDFIFEIFDVFDVGLMDIIGLLELFDVIYEKVNYYYFFVFFDVFKWISIVCVGFCIVGFVLGEGCFVFLFWIEVF